MSYLYQDFKVVHEFINATQFRIFNITSMEGYFMVNLNTKSTTNEHLLGETGFWQKHVFHVSEKCFQAFPDSMT